MKQYFYILFVFLLVGVTSQAQTVHRYNRTNGNTQLCGTFPLDSLVSDTNYSGWFAEGYKAIEWPDQDVKWKKELKDVQVTIFLGTWCGDSKKWVPRFVKLWDDLDLKRSQLTFIALYSSDVEGKYKQGPNSEEKGKDIHRVPTFIFEKNGVETARIVESPNNDLVTDIAQIALGYPSLPNYRGAAYLQGLFKDLSIEDIEADEMAYLRRVYSMVKSPAELNTLGYVLVEAGRLDEALLVFYFNTRIYKFDTNVYDSYAEALELDGQLEKAKANYEKVVLMDRSHEHAKMRLKALNDL